MKKAICVAAMLLALTACSSPGYQPTNSPCSADEASYQCQIYRYQNAY